MLMSGILSEDIADKEVIKNLLEHIQWLERRNQMAKILQDNEGNLYRVEHYELITKDQLLEEAQEFEQKAQELREYLGATPSSDKVSAPVEAPVNQEPVAPAPQAPTAAPAEPPVAAPAEAPQQQEQPAVVDPATAPAPVAPIVLS